MKEPYGKESSESILALSLAGDVARCRLKRRQRYRWAGLLSSKNPRTLRNNMHENREILHVLVSRSRPVREGHKPCLDLACADGMGRLLLRFGESCPAESN
jgi:hypothetical protein